MLSSLPRPDSCRPASLQGFADFSPVNTNQAFDYAHGQEVWREKLDYLQAWIKAHIEDSKTLGKRATQPASLPLLSNHLFSAALVIEEFGKAIPASFIYDSRLLLPGEWVQNDLTIRDTFFRAVYAAVEESALRGAGPIGGSNFWCASLAICEPR